ncbi:AfsR/SARP family transcriptional regulator [Amycolatopsis sp. NBC_01286]|uniref:AfsR/SARP family transcriptional regulator n=1 Tax=Amycolatopsis sp. NBC_01286 TaxID=2903560 RepID=UPI002E1222CF|nr:NB-ARC domain-containing protein [Amycolatopsis sp. NBC_01286]
MRFRLLGVVEVDRDGTAVTLGGPKPRTLLAALLLAEGQVLSVDRLISIIWDENPPESASALLHTYVSTLRRAFGKQNGEPGPGAILTQQPGYRIELSGCEVDTLAFARLSAEADALAAAGDHEAAVSRYDQALGRWRGPALGGLKSRFAAAESVRLEDQRLAAVERRTASVLALGRGPALVGELTSLVTEHPLRERLRGQLMTALWAAGRQADALRCYQAGRDLLVEELGIEPGADLRAVHQLVLRGDPPPPPLPEPPADRPEPAPEQPPNGPCLLPPDITDFTGRDTEAARLTEPRSRLVAIAGKPGSGKSSLAVHVGHRLRPRFPDGQLYVTLRGAQHSPVEPVEVLGRFLRALGVADADLPAGLDERVELYRALSAGRQLLVILDDAADERQVRPLLPSGDGCLCVLTSRVRLAALDSVDHIDLQVLDDEACLALLTRIVGRARIDAEPDAARALVHLCGNLPLAVRIVGARLAARPDWRPSRLLPRLREQRKFLNELTVGDLEVRGSLALSYNGLAARERAALRRLGWLGVPDFGTWLVSVLLEVPDDDAEDIVEGLVRAQLLDVVSDEGSGLTRYRLHDLVRVFGWERAEAEEDRAELRLAVRHAAEEWYRLVEWASGGTPMRALRPAPTRTATAEEEARTATLGDPLTWFDAEQAALVQIVERASELELADTAVRLATALCSSSFAVENHFHHWWRTHTAALEASRRAGDKSGQGLLLSGLGWLRSEQDRLDEAADYYAQALAAYAEVDDVHGKTVTRLMLSSVRREQGRLLDALGLLDAALPTLSALGDPWAEGRAHHGRGMVLTELGRLPESLAELDVALAGYRALPDQHGIALVLRSIGIAHRASGRLAEAERNCAEALEILHGIGDRLMVAYARQALAKVHIRQRSRPWDEVHAELKEAMGTCHDMQDGFGQALVLRTLGELELARDAPEAARRYLELALTWCDALSLPLWRARNLRDLAVALAALGRPAEADAAYAEALSLFDGHGAREAGEPRVAPPPEAPLPRREGLLTDPQGR